MKRWYLLSGTVILAAAMIMSCRQLYTSSLGSTLARDSISIPSSTSTSKLLEIAASSEGNDPDVASEILDILAGKDASSLLALSPSDKETVLNLVTVAAIDMQTITDLANDIKNSDTTTKNALIANVLGAFDTSVDLTAIGVLLTDQATVQNENVPLSSIVFASSVVLADAVSVIGADAVMTLLAAATPDYTGVPAGAQAEIAAIRSVSTWLGTRSDSGADLNGFNLTDLLKGTQP